MVALSLKTSLIVWFFVGLWITWNRVDSASSSWMKKLLPRYYPPWEDEMWDYSHQDVQIRNKIPLSKIGEYEWKTEVPPDLKNFIEFEFTKAEIHEKCSQEMESGHFGKDILMEGFRVIPIYFWPEKKVELPCLLCRTGSVFNGEPKSWKVLPGGSLLEIFRRIRKKRGKLDWMSVGKLESIVSGKKWAFDNVDLRDFFQKSTVPLDKLPDRWKEFVRTQDGKTEEEMEGQRNYWTGRRCRREDCANLTGTKQRVDKFNPMHAPELSPAVPRFYQRDGKLIIMHANADVQGAYYCQDETTDSPTELNSKVIYILLTYLPWFDTPVEPLFTSIKKSSIFPDIHNAFKETPAHPSLLKNPRRGQWFAAPECPRVPETEIEYNLFFPHYRWEWYWSPMYLGSSKNIDSAYDTNPGKEDLENLILPVRFTYGEDVLMEDINLEIFFHWSDWSSCDACAPHIGRRTREGHCHIRKTNPNRNIEIDSYGNLESAGDAMVFLRELNDILSTPPWRKEGLPIWSGLLPYLMFPHTYVQRKFFPYCIRAADVHKASRSGNKNIWEGLLRSTFLWKEKDSQGLMKRAYDMCVGGYVKDPDNIRSKRQIFGGYFYDVETCSDRCVPNT